MGLWRGFPVFSKANITAGQIAEYPRRKIWEWARLLHLLVFYLFVAYLSCRTHVTYLTFKKCLH